MVLSPDDSLEGNPSTKSTTKRGRIQLSGKTKLLWGTSIKLCPGADRFAGSESGRTQCTRRASHRDVASQSNHRHADFQSGCYVYNIL